jgi:Domain of Unknown Function (DUF349)
MENMNDNVLNEGENPTQPIENAEPVNTAPEPAPEQAPDADVEATQPVADVEAQAPEAIEEPTATETPNEPAVAPEPGESYIGEEAHEEVEAVASEVEGAPQTEDEIAEHHIEQTNYATLSKDELIDELAKLVEEADVKSSRVKVRVIRDFFNDILTKENNVLLVDFLNGGGLKEEFTPPESAQKDKFDALYSRYRALESNERKEREKELIVNLNTKKDILEELRTLIENEENDRKVFERFHEIQNRWRQVGNIPPGEVSHIWRTYNHYTTLIYNHIKQHRELRDLDMKKNLELKTELAQKAEEFIAEQSVKKAMDGVKALQAEWKQIGPVPKAQSDEVWTRFKSALDKVYERRTEYFGALQEVQQANLQLKLALIEKVEEVVAKDVTSAKIAQELTNEINAITDSWKSIGFAPKEQNEEIWKRFRAATKVFFDKRDDHYKEVKTEQHNNLKKKTDLCVQAEALQTSTDWKRTTNELIRLQQEWKAVGPIPKRYSDKLWTRFRAACDAFFNQKQTHFGSLAESEGENLVKKNELIARIEQLEGAGEPRETIKALNELQNEWSTIGHVPMKEKDAVYKRYRAALDAKFDGLKQAGAEFGAMRFKSKVDGMQGSSDALRKERTHWMNKASKLKNDIITLQNNIEFFARSKNADELRKNVENQINAAKKELVEVEEKLKTLREAGA